MHNQEFAKRHIGIPKQDLAAMLSTLKVESLDQLVDEVIPEHIRLKDFSAFSALNEQEYLTWISEVSSQNKVFRSFIGQGFYNSILPSVIARNLLENPAWYTHYTPYQPEISQGRLEALIAFQTMVKDLCHMEIANASLLDEASAGAEAMQMALRVALKQDAKFKKNKFFVDRDSFRSSIDVIKTRAKNLNVQLVIGASDDFEPDENYFGGIIQSPDTKGRVKIDPQFCAKLHAVKALAIVGCDLLSLTLLKPPGKWGADIVYGNSQRFGLPLNYGGPHAAFFATKEKFVREVPGRIVGISVDQNDQPAYRLTLQTREQHIKKNRATSNICTSQALLAIIAAMYACYHGPKGLSEIAKAVHAKALWLKNALRDNGIKTLDCYFFDTINIQLANSEDADSIMQQALEKKMNFFRAAANEINISLDETVTAEDLTRIIDVFGISKLAVPENISKMLIPEEIKRDTKFLQHAVFNSYHSETEMLRYLKQLESKDLSLANAMIPLGSCTMKLNPTSAMMPISWPAIKDIHPYAPLDQTLGYQVIIKELAKDLLELTGFDGVSFQPNSGAQGEFAGLNVIKSYFAQHDQAERDVVFIPSSAHGTNPASAAMCGMSVIFIDCDENGNVDLSDIKQKANLYRDKLACLMITYPSTHGVFEEEITEITDIIHNAGGQVYMDGANMNAQIGLTSPHNIKADVCHLNLHKTFGIPHGGGGPGVGPVLVAKHLVPFLPKHHFNTPGKIADNCVVATPWGSAAILVISLGYLKMLGHQGSTLATKIAILNANYILKRLDPYIKALYTNKNGWVAHELILDTRIFKKQADIDVMDIAKRLIDYGFHPPTVSFPVAGTLMIEPTESESKQELDRFCDALIAIKKEIDAIAVSKGRLRQDNLLKNAPHTITDLVTENWEHKYSKEQAVFPVSGLKNRKFWPSTKRINEVWGDRNLKCSLLDE